MVKIIPVFFLFFLLLCPAFPCAAASPPLVLNANTESSPLAGHIDILEDNIGKLTINEVSSPAFAGMFRPGRGVALRAGYTESVYWARFTIEIQATTALPRLLELDMPRMSYLDLYVPAAGGGFDLMQAGALRPMSIQKFRHRNPVFPLVIDGTDKTFYMRFDGVRRAELPLTVWAHEAFNRMDSRRALIHGCYFGAMMVMFAYNFFVFLSLRDRSYLFYILEILCFTLYVFNSNGFLSEFVTAEMPSFNKYAFLLIVPAALAGQAFSRNFLATARNTPFLDRLIKLNMLVVAILIPALLVVSTTAIIRAVSVIIPCSSLLILSAGVACLRRGYRPARYFVGARIFRFIGTLSTILAANRILPLYFLTMFGLQIGSIFEVVLLSFALADRINVMRREKEEAQAEAIRSSHLAALGELAAGVAHEINTPLNTIINSADLILENEDRKDTEHDVDIIKKQGRRIATIVKSLLFFSRSPEKEKVQYAVSELLQGTLDMIGAKLRKENIILTIQVPSDLMNVMVHPQQIEQVFLNILTNASHALDERHGAAHAGKTLEIDASEIVINDRPYVRIAFLDNGIGIPVSLLATVKDSFVTTKKTGTGLGLSISQKIIDEHGGAIEIESKAGEYTKVSVDLPAA
jgi:signal transduction histidine kinase